MSMNLNDYLKKSCSRENACEAPYSKVRDGLNEVITTKADKFRPVFDSNGIRVETEEEIENWKKI